MLAVLFVDSLVGGWPRCCFLYPLWHVWWEDRVTGDPSHVYISNVASPSFPPCHPPPTSPLNPHPPLPPHMTPSCFYCPCYIDLWNFQKFVEYDESPCKAYKIGKTWQIDHSNKISNSKLSAPDAFSPPFPLLPCGFYSPAKWDNTNLQRILWRQNTKRKCKNYYLERLIQTIPTIKFNL